MQSLEFNGPRVEIFAPHAPFLASATRAQPLRSTPDTLPDTSASAQIVSFELDTPPIFAQDDPPAIPFSLSAQATSSEPPASTAPNAPLITLASPSSLAAPKAQAIQPAASLVLNTRPEFTAAPTRFRPRYRCQIRYPQCSHRRPHSTPPTQRLRPHKPPHPA